MKYLGLTLCSLAVNTILAQTHISGNSCESTIPVVTGCSAPSTPAYDSGNPAGTVSSSNLIFKFNNINTNSTDYRIQVMKDGSISWNKVNGFGCVNIDSPKSSNLYEFVGSINSTTSFTKTLKAFDLDGAGKYWISARQYIPGPPPSPCGNQPYGVSEYSIMTSFTIPKPDLEVSSSGTSCNVNGTIVSCSLRVNNSAVTIATGVEVSFYLSKDPYITTSDVLFGHVYIGDIAASSSSSQIGVSVDVEGLSDAGTYYIGYLLDPAEVVDEQDETDNDGYYSGYTVNMPIGSIDAGITNPAKGLVIHRYNESSFLSSGGDLLVDGWSNTGKISSIRVYNTGSLQGSVSNPNDGTWSHEVDTDPGDNEIYIRVRCNYSGCPLSGTYSDTHTITYMKPLDRPRLTTDDTNAEITIEWIKHSNSGTSGFYYRVYRNTVDEIESGNDWTALGSWTQSDEYVDNSVIRGKKYYYWVVCATNSSGQYPSSFRNSSNDYLLASIVSFSDTVFFPKDTFYKTNSITSNGEWSASADSPWVSISNASAVGNGTIGLWLQDNPTGSTRYSRVTVSNAGTSEDFIISQEPSSPLPMELLYFKASKNRNDKVKLEWATSQEINGDFFQIERSKNGSIWDSLGIVKSKGNTNTAPLYKWKDHIPYNGLNFYRLLKMDEDGKFDYSDVRSLFIGELSENPANIFPNPFTNQITIEAKGVEEVAIYDQQSNLCIMNRYVSKPDLVFVNTTTLPVGVYVVMVKAEGRSIKKRLIKAK